MHMITSMAKFHGVVLLAACLALLQAAGIAGATTYKVGGSGEWSAPGPNAMSYSQWAERNRFKIGDSLMFVYPPGKDCVLQVNRDAYDACNTTAYVGKYDDGHTVFTFDRSGPFYFISGVEANCMRNESLHVVVLANRSTQRASSVPPSLAPSPPPTSSSSPAPASEAAPSPSSSSSSEPPSPPPPASSSESPPSETPPAPGSTEEAPAMAPAAEGSNPPPPPPPPSESAASSLKTVSSLGALIGSLWLCL